MLRCDSFDSHIPCQRFLVFSLMFQRMVRPMIELAPGIRIMELFACRSNHIYCRLTKTVYFRHSLREEFALWKKNNNNNSYILIGELIIKIIKMKWILHFWWLTEIRVLMQSSHHLLSKIRTKNLHRFGNSCHVWQRNPLGRLCQECLFALLRHLTQPENESRLEIIGYWDETFHTAGKEILFPKTHISRFIEQFNWRIHQWILVNSNIFIRFKSFCLYAI